MVVSKEVVENAKNEGEYGKSDGKVDDVVS